MDTQLVEEAATTPSQPQPAVPSTLFTSENARAMALRSHQVRRDAASNPLPPQVAADGFLKDELLSTRAECKRVGKLLSETKDAVKIDKLARALSTLREQERVLAGRPLPGALRPTSRRSRNQGGGFSPAE